MFEAAMFWNESQRDGKPPETPIAKKFVPANTDRMQYSVK